MTLFKLLHTKRIDTTDQEQFAFDMMMGKRAPTAEELQTRYDLVWQGEVSDENSPQEICEHFFHATNVQQVNGGFILPTDAQQLDQPRVAMYPKGYGHASTSVGDVIMLGDDVYLCADVGWTRLDDLSAPIVIY